MSFTKEEKKYFSEKLMELFIKEDVTQKRFCELVGIDSRYMSDYLHGRKFPKPDEFQKLAQYFGYERMKFYDLTLP